MATDAEAKSAPSGQVKMIMESATGVRSGIVADPTAPHSATRSKETSRSRRPRSSAARTSPNPIPDRTPAVPRTRAMYAGVSPGSMTSGAMAPAITATTAPIVAQTAPQVRPTPSKPRSLRRMVCIAPFSLGCQLRRDFPNVLQRFRIIRRVRGRARLDQPFTAARQGDEPGGPVLGGPHLAGRSRPRACT